MTKKFREIFFSTFASVTTLNVMELRYIKI